MIPSSSQSGPVETDASYRATAELALITATVPTAN